MQIAIRVYRDSDHEDVVKLWREAFPKDPPWNEPTAFIRRKRTVQPELFFVAQVGDAVIGTVVAGYDGVRGWIYHLAVRQQYRRQGIARALMEQAEQSLIALGCPKVNLQVRMNNTAVIAFYKALGYDIDERVQLGKRVKP